jgi:hypothetical protein
MSALITAIVSATLMGACGRSAHYVPPAAIHQIKRQVTVQQTRREPTLLPLATTEQRLGPSSRPAANEPRPQPPPPETRGEKERPRWREKAQPGRRQRRIWVPEPIPGRSQR